jgi:1,4-alpha-glucan branching enzyme
VPLPHGGRWGEVLNTDSSDYWGSNIGNMGAVEADAGPDRGQAASALLTLPPLAAIWLAPDA